MIRKVATAALIAAFTFATTPTSQPAVGTESQWINPQESRQGQSTVSHRLRALSSEATTRRTGYGAFAKNFCVVVAVKYFLVDKGLLMGALPAFNLPHNDSPFEGKV